MLAPIAIITLAALATATPLKRASHTSTIHPGGRTDLCIQTTSQYYGDSVDIAIRPCNPCSQQPIRFEFNDGPTRVKLEGYNYCLVAGATSGGGYTQADGNVAHLGVCPTESWVVGYEWSFHDGVFQQLGTSFAAAAVTSLDQCLDNKDGAFGAVQTWRCYDGNQNQQWSADA
ncbi:uncharacterized protein LOC62_02G003432 [Vanrija pseudolonga]|uniref:Ricin B lectin domain-containing protein n=1 Tax=Vanrija pseudolonga TaxID=143232 RepID=A0AAF1BPW5_9TREE|nr:hypothetical protein LOC62_02G003432 [Vanrija pseudolonga]